MSQPNFLPNLVSCATGDFAFDFSLTSAGHKFSHGATARHTHTHPLMDHRLNTTTAPIGAPVVGAPVAPVGATTFVDPRPVRTHHITPPRCGLTRASASVIS